MSFYGSPHLHAFSIEFSEGDPFRGTNISGSLQRLSKLAAFQQNTILGLEMMGWGWFLGLALLFAAPIFSQGRLQGWIKWLMVLYGVLGIVSSAGYLAASPVSAIGFIAWGLVLFIITGLLMVYFRRC